MRGRASIAGVRQALLVKGRRLTVLAAVSLGLAPWAPAQQAQAPGAAQKATSPTQVQKTAGQPAANASQQAKTPPHVHLPPGMRTLTLQEGRAIVQKMIWVDDEEGLSPDCSHLVHTLYEQAGYPYTYANSLDLYNGAIPFVRVRLAHPGDLIVWRGHVGIVINPKDHSFFGSTSSGTRIEHYDT